MAMAKKLGTFVYVRAQKKTFQMPPVVSKAAKLSIVGQRVENADAENRTAVFELKNNTDSEIVALGFSSGDGVDEDGYNIICHTEDQPYLASPQGIFQISVPLGGFNTKFPLRISAVVYADGTASGEPEAASYLKSRYEEARANKQGGTR